MNDKFIFSELEQIERPKDGKIFKVGDLVYWNDPDYWSEDKEYKNQYGSLFQGKIDGIWLTHYSWDKPDIFHVEISLDGNTTKPYPLGRLDLNDIEQSKDDIEDYYQAGEWNELFNEVLAQ